MIQQILTLQKLAAPMTRKNASHARGGTYYPLNFKYNQGIPDHKWYLYIIHSGNLYHEVLFVLQQCSYKPLSRISTKGKLEEGVLGHVPSV